MTNSGDGFELLGTAADEIRLLVHRGCGYSIPIPGHPVLSEPKAGSAPAYDVLALMADQPMELGFRLDELPSGTDPQALANTLALAYGTNRATEVPQVQLLLGPDLARGADAGASCIYDVRGSASGSGDGRTMEQLEVVVRAHPAGFWVLYYTVRYPVPGISPVQWAHFHAALRGHQHWDPSAPQQVAPKLFPASTFSESAVSLAFTEAGWAEARAKSNDLGPLSSDQTGSLIQALLEFSKTDAPPTMEMPGFMADVIRRRLRTLGPPTVAETLLRNLDQVRSQHDLRAWIWQCIWAIGNRASRHN